MFNQLTNENFMKKQFLILSLLIFSLNAMDAPDIESKETIQEGRVPTLLQLCVPAAAKQIQKDEIRKQFLNGSRALPAELEVAVGPFIINMHSVMMDILSLISIINKKDSTSNQFPNKVIGRSIYQNNVSPDNLLTITKGSKPICFILKNKVGDTQEFAHEYDVSHTCWSPDNRKVAVLTCKGKSFPYLCIWDIAKKHIIKKQFCLIDLGLVTYLNWSNDGCMLEVCDGTNWDTFDLCQLLKTENYFNGYFEDNGQAKDYLKQILLLTWIHDTKESRYFTGWRSLDISKDKKKKDIFSLLPPAIQQVMTKQYSVISEREQKEPNCLAS